VSPRRAVIHNTFMLYHYALTHSSRGRSLGRKHVGDAPCSDSDRTVLAAAAPQEPSEQLAVASRGEPRRAEAEPKRVKTKRRTRAPPGGGRRNLPRLAPSPWTCSAHRRGAAAAFCSATRRDRFFLATVSPSRPTWAGDSRLDSAGTDASRKDARQNDGRFE